MYAATIVVSCDPERQVARIVARDGVSEDQARALIATQLPMSEKEKVATYVIRNDGTPADLEARTLEVWALVVGSPALE
jgi:dephospho-CoA kinase